MVDRKFSPLDFNPRCLVEAATLMHRARQEGHEGILAAAIDHNKALWAEIRSLANSPDTFFSEETGRELTRLSDFIYSATKVEGTGISDMVLNTLINIDLQISEGLLDRQKG